MSDEGKVRVVIEGDASSLVSEAGKGKEALHGMDQGLGGLNQSLPEGSALFKKYKDVLSETTGATVSHREAANLLHLTLRNMGVELPGVGMLLRGLFNPATLGLVAGIAGIELFAKHIEHLNQKQREMIDLAGETTKVLKEIVSARPPENETWENWLTTLTGIEEKLHGIAAALEADARFAKNIGEVTKGIDQNKIEAAGKVGLAAKAEAERASITDQIAITRSNQGQAERRLAGLGDEGAAQAAKEADANRVADLKKTINELPKAIADDQSFVNRINSNINAASDIDIKNRNAALDRIDRFTELVGKSRADLPEAEKQAASSKANTEAYDTLRKNITNFSDEIIRLQNQRGVLEDRLHREAPEIAADTARRAAGTGKSELSTATSLSDQLLKGGKLSPAEEQFLMQVANLATGHTNTLTQAAQAIHKIEGNSDAMQSLLGKLVGIAEKNSGELSNLFSRVQIIEQQLHGLSNNTISH